MYIPTSAMKPTMYIPTSAMKLYITYLRTSATKLIMFITYLCHKTLCVVYIIPMLPLPLNSLCIPTYVPLPWLHEPPGTWRERKACRSRWKHSALCTGGIQKTTVHRSPQGCSIYTPGGDLHLEGIFLLFRGRNTQPTPSSILPFARFCSSFKGSQNTPNTYAHTRQVIQKGSRELKDKL